MWEPEPQRQVFSGARSTDGRVPGVPFQETSCGSRGVSGSGCEEGHKTPDLVVHVGRTGGVGVARGS